MSRLLDINIDSDILAYIKPYILEYYCFSLKLSSVDDLLCAANASSPVIPSE